MLVFDAHLDLAWNALDWNRDLLQSVKEIRKREQASDDVDFKARGRGTDAARVTTWKTFGAFASAGGGFGGSPQAIPASARTKAGAESVRGMIGVLTKQQDRS